ncbi:MAG: autotransporter domain-containing protein [Sphingomonas sp.]|nr:autotransporter domain-containing protein [Sphingomonas sp.]
MEADLKKFFVRSALFSSATWILPAAPAAFLIPTQAQAQTVCTGLPGNIVGCADGVTTTVTGTVNAGTDTLLGPGLTATSDGDLIATVTGDITTTGDNEPGVLLVTADDLIFTLDGTITTLGDNSDGVNLTGTTVTADLGDVFTQGIDSDGVEILATDGGIILDVDVIETEGDLSSATILRASGDINLTADALSTSGIDAVAIDISVDPAVCVTLAPGECDITAAAESVTTDGFGGIGALIAAAGDTDVTIGVLETNGDQAAGLDLSADPTACVILGAGACDTAFTVGSLTTNGDDSPGALVFAIGDIDASVGVLETNGDRSVGLDLTSDPTACAILGAGACDTSFTVGTLTTEGAGATGILIRAAGDTTGSVGILETNGDDAFGIDIRSDPTACVIVGVGACDVGLVADQVTTNGDQAAAVFIETVGAITADLGLIETSGDGSPGVVLRVDPTLCLAIGPGTCTINATIDEVDTGGDNSPGVVVDGGDGPTDVTTGDVDTDGDNSPGVDVGGTGPIDVTTGDVDTDGDDSPGVVVDGGEGPIDVVVGDVDTDGDNSPGVDVEGTGPIDVITGDVDTGGDNSPGIIIDGADDTVNLTCGNVVTAGDNSPGIDVDAQGEINVNCESVTTAGNNSDGIQITGDTGPVSVTVGPVVTAGADSDGIDVTTSTGNIAIVAGPVTVTGPGSDAISAVATGCADININATNDIVSAQGTAILASTLCAVNITTQPGASVTGAVAGIDATSGTGTTITLNDSVRATAGPAIDVDGAAALINVNAGGSIIGRIDLTDNNDVLNNRGLIDVIGTSDFRSGSDVINNLAGGTVRSTNGNGVLANCETFNNSGTITMIDGAANDTLTVCGNYVGTGNASLGIDVGGGAGGLTGDRLIVPGNASGSTGVNVNLLAGSAVIDPDGVLIVDAGTATGDPFSLAAPIPSAGLINFGLEQRGADTFLASRPDEVIFDLATLAQFGSELWYQSSNAHLSCAAARRNAFGLLNRSPLSVCGQAYLSEDRIGDSNRTRTVFSTPLTFSDRLKTKRWGAQLDIGYRPTDNLEFGVTGGYAHSEADLSSGSDFETRGYNVGLYAEYGMATGLYAGLLVKHDVSKLRFSNPLIVDSVRPRVKSTGIDGEAGWRTPAMGAMLDLGAGLSYVRAEMDDFDAGFVSFDDGRTRSLRGRVGARMTWAGSLGPFVDAKLFHEFEGDSRFLVGSGNLSDRLDGSGRGTWGRLEGGLAGGPGGGPLLSAWLDLGDVRGWGVRAGYRFGGSAAPPPPPMVLAPPPPPAPATQTCPDGSVILATDICAAPPLPPPPPAPAPERG